MQEWQILGFKIGYIHLNGKILKIGESVKKNYLKIVWLLILLELIKNMLI